MSCRYSVVVEGERGNRPHIYCLEQLLQEAVSTAHCPYQSLMSPTRVQVHTMARGTHSQTLRTVDLLRILMCCYIHILLH